MSSIFSISRLQNTISSQTILSQVAANTVPALSEEHRAAIAANREAHAAAVAANFDAASAAAAAGDDYDYEYSGAAIVGAKSNFAPGIQEQG